jgi:hypothetical protein
VSALAAQLADSGVRIALHLAETESGRTSGTFVATGLLADSGTTCEVERFPALRRGVRGPVVVSGAESLVGVDGSIALSFDGVFRPAASDIFTAKGRWRVTGGDHAYERLDADGTWTGTARFSDRGLTVDVIYEGSGRLGPQPGGSRE